MQPLLGNRTIAITRPAGQAGKLSTLIEAAGGKPLLFQLISITALTNYDVFDKATSNLKDYDWAIFISSNAVQNSLPRLSKQIKLLPKTLKFAAIGPSTASELNAFGIENVLIPKDRFDSESLLSLAEMQNMTNQKVMIFRGVGGREVLAESLKLRGAHVDFAESYQRINPQTNTKILDEQWHNKTLDALVITSSEAMRHLIDLAKNTAWLKQIKICVNHLRIAEEANNLGLNISVAETSGDEAMLKCLIKTLKG
jgi:uroporphyrinogen-III synthase